MSRRCHARALWVSNSKCAQESAGKQASMDSGPFPRPWKAGTSEGSEWWRSSHSPDVSAAATQIRGDMGETLVTRIASAVATGYKASQRQVRELVSTLFPCSLHAGLGAPPSHFLCTCQHDPSWHHTHHTAPRQLRLQFVWQTCSWLTDSWGLGPSLE